jgi:hypothetical protein
MRHLKDHFPWPIIRGRSLISGHFPRGRSWELGRIRGRGRGSMGLIIFHQGKISILFFTIRSILLFSHPLDLITQVIIELFINTSQGVA